MELKRGVLGTIVGLVIVVGVACGGSATTFEPAGTADDAATSSATQDAAATVAGTDDATEAEVVTLRQELSIPDLVTLAKPAIVHIRSLNSIGTGFIIDADGYIITNNHVIESALSVGVVQVTLFDGSEVEATIVGADPRADIALLKIDATGLVALPLADLDDVVVGQAVVAIGFPLDLIRGEGASFTVTTGIVSAKNRQISSTPIGILGAIQTDAAINSGNSGGPLINLYGEVVGVNTAIAINQRVGTAASGIGFAVGSDTVAAVYDELREDGSVDRALLGISSFEALSPAAAQEIGLPEGTQGVIVIGFPAPGPVGQAGMREGDVIVQIGKYRVPDESKMAEALIILDPGDIVEVRVFRGSELITLSVTLGDAGNQ